MGIAPGVPVTDLARYLATVNLSGGKSTWPYELKTLPRPTGQATRVIITQWDMPRRGTVSHDMDVDANGIFWYTDESRMFVSKLDLLRPWCLNVIDSFRCTIHSKRAAFVSTKTSTNGRDRTVGVLPRFGHHSCTTSSDGAAASIFNSQWDIPTGRR